MKDLSIQLAEQLLSKHWMLATAESCTGGLIATTCTDLAGSSAWFDRAFVTYSNAAKSDMLGVSSDLIRTHGAVSEPVARAMALGAVYRSLADVSVAVTGVAGPGGGSDDKPVGTVWVAWNIQGRVQAEVHFFPGDRQQVRHASARCAMTGLITLLTSKI